MTQKLLIFKGFTGPITHFFGKATLKTNPTHLLNFLFGPVIQNPSNSIKGPFYVPNSSEYPMDVCTKKGIKSGLQSLVNLKVS